MKRLKQLLKISRPARSPSFGGYVDSPHKVYVGNLAWIVTSESLKEAFNTKGNVLGAKVIQDRETGRSRGFGFVYYSSEAEVEAALSEMNGLVTTTISSFSDSIFKMHQVDISLLSLLGMKCFLIYF